MEANNFKLINGKFKPEEARNILFTLVNTKINFHAMEAFGISIRSSGDTSFHDRRIEELTKMNLDIRQVLDFAAQNNLDVMLSGDIKISLVNKQNAG